MCFSLKGNVHKQFSRQFVPQNRNTVKCSIETIAGPALSKSNKIQPPAATGRRFQVFPFFVQIKQIHVNQWSLEALVFAGLGHASAGGTHKVTYSVCNMKTGSLISLKEMKTDKWERMRRWNIGEQQNCPSLMVNQGELIPSRKFSLDRLQLLMRGLFKYAVL